MASSASGGSSSWIADRNVPGHTQFTRMPSRAYSTAATLARWITAAFVAQYGAACDQAVSPETEAVSTMDPDRCGRMTPTAALMPWTAPSTLTSNARRQSSVVRLWIRPFGDRTPALLTRTSRRPNRSVARSTTACTWSRSDTSATTVSTSPRTSGRPVDGGVERAGVDVAEYGVGVGLAGQASGDGRTECSTGAEHDDDASMVCAVVGHTSRYPPSTLSTVPVTNAEASDARNW